MILMMIEDELQPDEEFERLVAEALDSIPPGLLAWMENVQVTIEDEPPPEIVRKLSPGGTLFGLYEGIPRTSRDLSYQSLPDKITIYRGPIVRSCVSAGEIMQEVRRTVIHEVAHHFGIDDARLKELGW